MNRVIALLAQPWPPQLIGAFLFLGGLTLGLLFCTGGCGI
jgi:hypothetical protein